MTPSFDPHWKRRSIVCRSIGSEESSRSIKNAKSFCTRTTAAIVAPSALAAHERLARCSRTSTAGAFHSASSCRQIAPAGKLTACRTSSRTCCLHSDSRAGSYRHGSTKGRRFWPTQLGNNRFTRGISDERAPPAAALPLPRLLSLEDYPGQRHWPAFYGESLSLVRFLVECKSPRKFVDFVDKSLDRGYDAALRDVYGIGGVEELRQLWSRHVDQSELSGYLYRFEDATAEYGKLQFTLGDQIQPHFVDVLKVTPSSTGF